jgi:hypothetical protein
MLIYIFLCIFLCYYYWVVDLYFLIHIFMLLLLGMQVYDDGCASFLCITGCQFVIYK